MDIKRTFRNISGDRESLDLGAVIDEWFHKGGRSEILSFGYIKEGQKIDSFEVKKDRFALTTKPQTVSLAPSEEITTWIHAKEIKRTNDVYSWVFACPTKNPMVIVKPYDGISVEAGFGYREKPEMIGENTYRLRGTLLPNQSIYVRWWKVADSEEWQQGE